MQTVDYDLGSGRIGNKRRFASFPPDTGFPEGATVDEEDPATLYATSMPRPPVPDGPQDGPSGGSVVALRDLGVRGLPERRFGG